MESHERFTRRKQIAQAVATEAAFGDANCAKYNRVAEIVAEAIIEHAEQWYVVGETAIMTRDMTVKANKFSRQRIRQEYGFVISTWILMAVLSGVVSAVVRIIIERWLRKEQVNLYQLRMQEDD